MIQALVFDFDGLIVDTEWPDFQSWQEIGQEYGVAITIDEWAPCIGTNSLLSKFEAFDYLQQRTDVLLNREALLARRLPRHQELLATQPILPGVEALIGEAKQRGMGLAVASSSPRKWVVDNLSRLGLLTAFDALACGDEVVRVKPYPEIYLLALEKLGVQANQAMAFEDSLNGMLAAQRAGIFCVVVTNPLTHVLPFEKVDLRLKSLADLSLDQLIEHTHMPGSVPEK